MLSLFKKKKIIIEPDTTKKNVLIQISDPAIVTKELCVTVPSQYRAIGYINQEALLHFKEPCACSSVVEKYDRSIIGNQLVIAFVLLENAIPKQWGFGNIKVHNKKLNQTYTIGANGAYFVEIIDEKKLIANLPHKNNITIYDISEKIGSVLDKAGKKILQDLCTNTEVSVFDINSLTDEFIRRFLLQLQKEGDIVKIGVKVSSITVSGFHVDDEDIRAIRSTISEVII